jgi:branched-chain amino acid transport system permease protein
LIEALIIFGAITSGTLALLALGFTLIYGVAGVVNLAHGVLYMLGAYMFFAFVAPPPFGIFQLDLIPALILTVIFVGLIGTFLYRLAIHPVVEDLVSVLVITVAAIFILQHVIMLQFGTKGWPVPSFVQGYATILGVKLKYSRILAFVVSLALFACIWIFVRKTKIGTAMRAISQDREAAMLMGINTERIYMLTMAIASSLAAIAGILVISSTTGRVNPYIWSDPLIQSFAIVILGGLGSIKGTLIGAFILGYANVATFYLVPGGMTLGAAVPMVIMLIILLLRPKGLFGKRIELE